LARLGFVRIGPRCRAERDFADPLGMVGHRCEVEWTIELRLARADAVLVKRPETDRLATGEAERVIRGPEHVARTRIHRILRVDMEVAEERLPEGGPI